MRARLAAAVLGISLWGASGMEEVPFEVLRERPRRQAAEAQYEAEKRGGAWIVTIHAGRRPTGGYRVEVRKVEREGTRCVVHYRVLEPPPDAMVPQVITYPAVMVRFEAACAEAMVEPPLPRASPEGEER
ncbi:MAG: hypothetical protein KatS3mg005_1379 [Bryobacteraceae bacterium]|jgi:hypothetical protein|nr:MAG: hypothetical protein KatS3mg005_1379 [Bryobacteraceae bacterium]